VTDNLLVDPADYNPYCITAPTDPRLPGGGGYQVCGLYDVSPSRFGQLNNLVTRATNYGGQSLINNFFGVTVNGRFRPGFWSTVAVSHRRQWRRAHSVGTYVGAQLTF
jgi:hypothetical protein